MDDSDDLGVLVARWRAISLGLQADPDCPLLTAQAQEVGSALLTLCRQLGVDPTLAMIDEGTA